ncbi:PPOX class F420-dependent oxidoreductase [Actinoplanes sp. L3-i22]|uniref:PPOX class F420-dependent oxidoreductase n=1 Tax=Actinoplanes sp. L3-i22 TaxID=2836373 RepID=UPI001C74F769|nr:PPOX class F420-dependent oxidoreductase [Actinoplanes sp. L3-i22]BCY08273.1 PPOX class F420-dependent enzyme [Actinoplanes sp. L3-i22]
MTDLPTRLIDLLEAPSPCLIATTNPDGSPQLTQTWVDTDGKHVLINTVRGFRKLRNIERDPRVAVSVLDGADPSNYYSLAGTVISTDTEGARESIDRISRKYTGGPYQNYGGGEQTRVLLTIRVDRVVHAPWH